VPAASIRRPPILPPVRSAFLARLCRDSEPNTRIFLAYLAARNAHSTPSSVGRNGSPRLPAGFGQRCRAAEDWEAHKHDRERGQTSFLVAIERDQSEDSCGECIEIEGPE